MYHRNVVRSILQLHVNPVVKILIISDFLIWAAAYFIEPIFALFVIHQIPGASEVEVGISFAIYTFVKAMVEIPIGVYVDKHKGELDDFWVTVIGSLLGAAVLFVYPHMTTVWQLYSLRVVMGIAMALAYPGWMAIFTHHLDKNKEGFEWSLYDVLTGLGVSATAALGGFMVAQFGYQWLLYLVGVLTIIGSMILFLIRGDLYLAKQKNT